MEYIIKSESYRLLKSKINELTNNIDNIIYFDLSENNIDEIIEECNYNNLFNELKCIIVNNTNLFNTKYEYKEELNKLKNYLNNPNKLTTLIFITDSISLKKKCVKIIKDKGNLIELNLPNEKEINNYIIKYLNNINYKIDNIALAKLISNCNNNYDIILNELDKILIIKTDNTITLDDINKYSIKINNDSIFDFVDSIIKKDKKKIFTFLKKFIDRNEEVAVILSNLATQYRLIYSTKLMIKENKSEKEIADYLNIHPYRVKLAHTNSLNYSSKELIDKLLNIGILDEKIKSGLIDKYIGLKIFLINL